VLAKVPTESRKRKPRKERLKILQKILTLSRQRLQGKRQRFEEESPESRPKSHKNNLGRARRMGAVGKNPIKLIGAE
jgi:hypothetical protein